MTSGDWTAGTVAGSIIHSPAYNHVFVIDTTILVFVVGVLFPPLDNSFLVLRHLITRTFPITLNSTDDAMLFFDAVAGCSAEGTSVNIST